MVSEKTRLVNEQGFHMRPATDFANAMQKYDCDIKIEYNDNQINAKSMMNIIAAGIRCGSDITIMCDGKDENKALREAVDLIESGLSE